MKKGNKKTNYNFSIIFDALRDAMAQDAACMHMPRGNGKTGTIPAFNLLPGATCSPAACAHCMQEDCYAIKNLFRGGYDIESNNVFRSWLDNTVLAKKTCLYAGNGA